MSHLKAHWHHHLALWGTLLSVFILGAGTSQAYTRWHGHGFVQGPIPPPIHIGGSPRLPAAWWLNRYLVRIHNQGNSNSCVAQTLATIEEITYAERDARRARWHKQFSAGYIWNQVNGGQNVGVTYDAAFAVLTRKGDARLRDFSPDGATGYWIYPGARATQLAAPYRFAAWHSIANTDRTTIKYEVSHGRPLAVAMPILDSMYNHWQTSGWITGQSGNFDFWHSMTIIGYNLAGVELMNSWGPQWGDRGHSMITWSALAASGAVVAVATPRLQLHQVRIPKFGKGTLIRAAP